jgi:hypothetical protein
MHGAPVRTAPHPGFMPVWPDIACQRGHESHASKLIDVRLGGQSGYADYPPVPARLARSFEMLVFQWRDYGDGPYCPAHDAVSETVDLLGIWEPPETIMALTVFESAPLGSLFLDLGAQVGWFSLLAASSGLGALAVEADSVPLGLLHESARRNGWDKQVQGMRLRIASDTFPFPAKPYRLVKLDLEGAECDGIRILRPSLEAGLVEHLCCEVSPVFAPGYGALVESVIDLGYDAYLLPPKAMPPHRLKDPERDLTPLVGNVAETVESFHQETVWLKRVGASW